MPSTARKERYAIGLAHRRAGKTVACINDGIKLALEWPIERCKVSYIAPFRQQGKDIAWEYLKAYSRPLWGRIGSRVVL